MKTFKKQYIVVCYLILFFNSFIVFSQDVSYKELVSLSDSSDTLDKIKGNNALGNYFNRFNYKNLDSTIYFAEKSKFLLDLYNIDDHSPVFTSYKQQQSSNYKLWASINIARRDLDSAQYYQYKSLGIDSLLNDYSEMAINYNNLSVIASGKQDYAESIEHSLSAMSILETLGKEREINYCQENIGMYYLLLIDYKKSKEYLKRALNGYVKIGDSVRIASIYGALTNVSLRTKNVDSASYYLSKSRNYKKSAEADDFIYLFFKGEIALIKGEYDTAIMYLKKSMKLIVQLNNKRDYDVCKSLIAEAYLSKKEPEVALAYLLKRDSVFGDEFIDNPDRLRDSLLYATYEMLDEPEKSLFYFKRYQKAITPEEIHRANNIETAREIHKREAIIANQDNVIKGYFFKNTFLFIAIIFVVLISIFFLLRSYKKRRELQKENLYIAVQYNEVNKTNIALNEKLLRISAKLTEEGSRLSKSRYRRSSLDPKLRDEIMNKILTYMDTEKPYLDTDLSQKKLAEKLDVTGETPSSYKKKCNS